MAGSLDWLRYANGGATRNMALSPALVSALGFLPGMGVSAEVFSGGQPRKGSGLARVGSTRHDGGNAADVRFYRDGRRLDWSDPADQPVFADIVRWGKAAGLTGFGAGPGYMAPGTMHVGFGAPGVWGAGGRSANAPAWLREAYGLGAAPAGRSHMPNALPSFDALDGAALGSLPAGASERASAGMAMGSDATPRNGAAAAIDAAVPRNTGNGGDMAGRNYRAEALANHGGPGPMTPANAPTTQEAGPVVNVGRFQDTRNDELVRARLMQQQIRNPFDAIGGLAQVWAQTAAIRDKETANAGVIDAAVSGGGFDPDIAMLARSGGTRDDLQEAMELQHQRRAEAEQRAWRSDERDYQRGRDAVGDQRQERMDARVADQQLYERGRDAMGDQRFQAQQDYQRGRDTVADQRADWAFSLQERIATQNAEPYKTLTSEDAKRMGLPDGAYQMGPNGKVSAIGKGGVTVNTGATTSKFCETNDVEAAKRLGTIVEAGNAAPTFMGDIQQLGELGKAIGTGRGAQITAALGPYAAMVGIKLDGLDETQAFQAITSRLAPQMRPAGSGATSDFDARQFLGSLPSLGNTPDGNAIISDTFRAVSENKMAAAEIASRAQSGEMAWQDAERQIRQLPNPYERFRTYRGEVGGGGGAQGTPGQRFAPNGGPSGTGLAASAPVPQRARNPQTGAIVEFRNGQWVPVR